MIMGNELDVRITSYKLKEETNFHILHCLGTSNKSLQPGSYFIKVKIILSLKFKINLICYLIKEFMKHSCLNFFYEIVNKISTKVKRNWNLKNLPRLKDDQFFLNPDFKKILTFMK